MKPLLRTLPLTLLLVAATAHGEEDLVTARALGMGGAGRGAATGAMGPLVNPAGMVLQKAYIIEALYGFGFSDLGSTLHASIVDSVTSRIAAGVYYTFVHSSPRFAYAPTGLNPPVDQNNREGHETGLSIAVPLGDKFSFGVTAKYITMSTDVPNPFYNANVMGSPKRLTVDSSTSAASADGFTLDTGVNLHLSESLSIGVAGYNLIPLRSVEAPLGLGAGVTYMLGQSFTIALDVVVHFNRWKDLEHFTPDGRLVHGDDTTTVRVAGGAEYAIAGRVPIRLGFIHDNGLSGTYLTAGVGYLGQTFGIDLAYRQKVSGGDDSMLVLGLRVTLQ